MFQGRKPSVMFLFYTTKPKMITLVELILKIISLILSFEIKFLLGERFPLSTQEACPKQIVAFFVRESSPFH